MKHARGSGPSPLASNLIMLFVFAAALGGCGGGSDTAAPVAPEQRNGWTREGPGYRVTRAGFEQRKLTWPFTVDDAVIGCDREALWLVSGSEVYALNGWATHLLGHQLPYDIWKYNEELKAASEAAGLQPEARINIADVLSEARKFCAPV